MKEIEFTSAADGSIQKALFFTPDVPAKMPMPLVVGLHQWSFHMDEPANGPAYLAECRKRGWAFIYPDFRGPNSRPEACASELARQDIADAVEYAKQHADIDVKRIYLVGASGGGMMSLMMAGTHPEIWAAVSAWVPILDIKVWHADSRKRGNKYAGMLEACCGGAPGDSKEVDTQYRRRSPKTFLKRAVSIPMDINAGIHDGHTGSVPISHSLKAFNLFAKTAGMAALVIRAADIKYMVDREAVPATLKYEGRESFNRMHDVLLRRQAGKTRVTIFEGGHDVDPETAFRFFEGKKRFGGERRARALVR